MATLADSLVSSSARAMPIRKRPDLSARRQRYQGRSYWVVKEPIGLNYFRFQEEEFAILNMLDGAISLDELKERFEEEFPPQKITVEELQQFIGMLHRSGLVITGSPGQGPQLKKRGDERKRKELLGKFTNLLAIRFKGIDPERVLNWMYPKVRFFFTRWGVAMWFIATIGALLLITVQFDVFRSKLPGFHQFFGPQNWLWLGAALALTKVIHEFGHGLSCKHFGGECHEIGVMILVLTPCLYCNVSDSWMLPSKWGRAMIGAAGMYIELFLASVATFIWWFSEPGLLNNTCLSIMFVSSVSTLLFNANPLLRYDGYYILADIVEIPNLRQKSTKIVSRKLGKWCLGLEEPEDPFLPKRNHLFFAIYTVAAVVYRWVILFSILFFLFKVFEPYRLEVIGYAIGSISIIGLVVMPLWKVGKFFYVPGRIDKVKKPRMYTSMALLAAVILAIVYVPLPFSVMSTVYVEPHNAASVYVNPGGVLKVVHVQPGQWVEKGTLLAELENLEIELGIQDLVRQQKQFQTRLGTLMRQQFQNRAAQREIPTVRETLAVLQEQLASRRESAKRLKLRAPRSGFVFPPPNQPAKPGADGQLPQWSGTPFDKKNLGVVLSPPQLFCQIGDKDQWHAVLVIDQADIEFITADQQVEIRLDQLPREDIESTIATISSEPLEYAPRNISRKAGGELATEQDQTGAEKPQSTSFQAHTVMLDPEYARLMRIGLRGRAKIEAGTKTLGGRFWRFIRQTFSFHL